MKTLELGQYYGTESYHSLKPFKTIATDGIIYIMNHGYSRFITDSLAVIEHQPNRKMRNYFSEGEGFLSVTLDTTNKDDIKMIIEDGNGHILYIQKYDCIITDHNIPENQLKIYWIDGVMLLVGEY